MNNKDTTDFNPTDDFDSKGTDAFSGEHGPEISEALPFEVGRYRIIRELGHGGFGEVFLGRDDELQRLVAIKMPRARQLTTNNGLDLFLKEAQKAARLRHPCIVTIHDVGRIGQSACYVVMEYVDGESLASLLKRTRTTFTKTADVLSQVAAGLHVAHKQGIYHRDIKPANIMIDASGFPRIVDFGLSISEEERTENRGEVAGSLQYMSPEQVRGEIDQIDGRSDIWSFGVVLYEMLTGRRPFESDSVERTLYEITERDPVPPSRIDRTIPEGLERITLRCLAKERDRRYDTAALLYDDLREWVANSGEGNWDPYAPLTIEDYEVLEPIQGGNLTTLYRAMQKSLMRPVAIRLLNSEFSRSSAVTHWFLSSVHNVATLRHNNLVGVLGLGRTKDGGYFVAMENVKGISLRQGITQTLPAPTAVISVMQEIAAVVMEFHRAGIENVRVDCSGIFVSREMNALVAAGFGGPCFNSETGGVLFEATETSLPISLASPEDEKGSAIYCLGLIMHELVTGQDPFRGLLPSQQVGWKQPSPREINSQVPRDLEAICLKCLRQKQNDGYSNVAELMTDLRKAERRRQGWLGNLFYPS